MASKTPNGNGSVSKRADGRYQVAVRMKLPDGTTKRTYTTAKSRKEAEQIRRDRLERTRRGIPSPPRIWAVDDYLDHWMNNVVAINRRDRTVELYGMYIRLYIKPAIGRKRLTDLSVQDVQLMINWMLEHKSIRLAHGVRSVLRAALNRAMREELLFRNVATLVELPAWRRKSITPWTVEQAGLFLRRTEADGEPWHLAFQMLLMYGMRRGEVLGLRWSDIDLERGLIHVERQLQMIRGQLVAGPVKTEAGRRALPILPVMRGAILDHLTRASGGVTSPATRAQLVEDGALVFTSAVGTPIDPNNFVRTFHRIRIRAGLPRITIHHLRHTAATILKNLGVPARDAQLILGHAQISTTQELYQHGDVEGQARALALVERQMLDVDARAGGGQNWRSNAKFAAKSDEFDQNNLGGPGGDRTHDVLLKRHLEPPLAELFTSGNRLLRAITIVHKMGAVAVKAGGQKLPQPATHSVVFFNQLRSVAHLKGADHV